MLVNNVVSVPIYQNPGSRLIPGVSFVIPFLLWTGVCCELPRHHLGEDHQPLWYICIWTFLGLGHEGLTDPQLRPLLDHQYHLGADRGKKGAQAVIRTLPCGWVVYMSEEDGLPLNRQAVHSPASGTKPPPGGGWQLWEKRTASR